jgi:hypothetical protein
MRSSMRLIVKICVLGLVCGSAVASLLPPEIKRGKLFVGAESIPDLPALSCKQQAWPNADRECLTWTALRREPEKVGPGRDQTALASARIVEPVAAAERASPPANVTEEQPTPPAAQVTAQETTRASGPATRLASRSKTMIATHARKPRSADRRAREALGLVRSFGDNLSDVPATSYAFDRTRRTVIRPTSIQDVYFYERRGMLSPSTAPIAPQ